MKKFLVNIIIFLSLIGVTILSLMTQVDGFTDPFYYKVASPKQESLILGSSKASIGLVPSVFNEELETNMFNYAFTVGSSPYGPIYLNSVQKKLDKNSKTGVFILTVDPWSIACFKENINNIYKFREHEGPVGETEFVNIDPNLFYAFNGGDNFFKKVIKNLAKKKEKSSLFLHEDGWLEVDLEEDSLANKNRVNKALKSYRKKLLKNQYSTIRKDYLIKTISYLSSFGRVYLVRLPVASGFQEIEDSLMPRFNSLLEKIAIKTSVKYLDMNTIDESFQYTDGVHLQPVYGKRVSKIIADWIREN